MSSIKIAVIAITLITLTYSYFKIKDLKSDLEISQMNNTVLQQSLDKQLQTIEELKDSILFVQGVNQDLNQELQNKDQAIRGLQASMDNLKALYQKDPVLANKSLNIKIKMYNQCLKDITLGHLDSETCKDFY